MELLMFLLLVAVGWLHYRVCYRTRSNSEECAACPPTGGGIDKSCEPANPTSDRAGNEQPSSRR